MSCRVDPTKRCTIGNLEGWMAPKTIQIDGCSASDVIRKHRSAFPINKKYSIFLIAEAPGKQEDDIDVPMVGDAGDILVGFLEKTHFPIDETFITNSTRCRPPKNRKPSRGEQKACKPYLIEELKQHQPKVIMLLGNTALSVFKLTEGGISKNRGKVFRLKLPDWEDGPEFTIVPTFHPSYFNYRNNPQLRKLVEADFRLAASLARGEEIKDTKYQATYKVCQTVDKVAEAVQVLKQNGKFACDTESPNLKFMTSPMILLQLSGGIDKTFLIPFYQHDPDGIEWKLKPVFNNDERNKVRELLKNLFEDVQLTRSLVNIKYDANVIRRWLDIDILAGPYHDLAIMHHLIYEYPPHDLEFLADTQFQSGDYSYPIREIVGHGKDLIKTYDYIPDKVLWDYGANDAELTYRLEDEWLGPDLQSKPHLWKLYQEESLPLVKALRKAEWMGNKVDLKKVDEMEELYKKRLEEALQECRKFSPDPELNPNSHDQVNEVLKAVLSEEDYEEFIVDDSKASGYSTSKDKLTELDNEFARAVLRHRKYKKLLSTYVDRIREDVDEQGRVRYQFGIASTATARLAARLLHQIPRIDKEAVKNDETVLREIFIEDEGYEIIYWDWSQLELFVFAYLSGEEELIKVLENGEDIHSYTAAAALEIESTEVSKTNRDNIGKPMNFSVIFGGEGSNTAKLIYEDPITGEKKVVGKERSFQFARNFRKKYKKVDLYLKRVLNITRMNGGIYTTPFGREKRAFNLTQHSNVKNSKTEREVLNFSVQSPAGAIGLRTIILIDKILEQNNIGLDKIRLINSVHDSISYGVKKSLTSWFADTLRKVAQRPIPELQGRCFPGKLGIGLDWAQAEMNSK